MYHFITLTEDEKHQRRHLLDQYATIAQLSTLIPLFAFQIYHVATWATKKWMAHATGSGARSPNLKDVLRRRGVLDFDNFRFQWRRFAWWCGDSIDLSGFHLGTRGELFAAVAWMMWLLCLCFAETGEDYLHFTKRFGLVAASQLPVHYLLSSKSPFSPIQLLTRRSHESLNSIHQLLGRVVTLLLLLHAVCYINFYVLSGLLAAKLQEAYVLCGVFSIISFTVLGTTALAPVRNWNYRIFHAVHVALATAILPLLFFHVSHIRIYLYETVFVLIVSALHRYLQTTRALGEVRLIPNTNLVEITVPTSSIYTKENTQVGQWQAGQHAYISLPGHPFLRTFRSNPFSVASMPSMDKELRFVARVLDGNTAKLAQHHNKSNTPNSSHLSIEGPYGVVSHAERLLQYDRVLFVAGGVGGTFLAPLYRQLLADLSPSKGTARRARVSFLWTVRALTDVTWALPADERERAGFVDRLRVCVTRAVGQVHIADDPVMPDFTGASRDADTEIAGEHPEAIELEEQHRSLLASSEATDQTVGGLTVHAGRPDLARTVEQLFSHAGAERVAVMVCGPRALRLALRRELGRYVYRGREVWFWEEGFAL